MYDVIKVLATFGAFIGICALCEWIADNAPFMIWILIPVALYVTIIATFGNHMERKKNNERK